MSGWAGEAVVVESHSSKSPPGGGFSNTQHNQWDQWELSGEDTDTLRRLHAPHLGRRGEGEGRGAHSFAVSHWPAAARLPASGGSLGKEISD